MMSDSLDLIANHVLANLTPGKPLCVAVQGPQGSGKTFLSGCLQTYLEAPPHSLRVAVFSIDDIYLPHEGLRSLANSHPQNVLWKGRGQPGTHDVNLGVEILCALKSGARPVELPRFDKSLFDGEGDRLPIDGSGTVVKQPPPLDVIIFEGWCVGFRPISNDEIVHRWNGVWKTEREKLGLREEQMGRLVDVQAVNEKLKDYVRIWNHFDAFVQLKPTLPVSEGASQFDIVYKWRLEQEHYMKAHNGGRGMTDAAVRSFVDRYIPGYIFFGDILSPATGDKDADEAPKRTRKGLTLFLDETRAVIRTALF
ncbi:P-loop containing nucleoside triphosphate hydrolase protein [Crassisporium funariophilum]|nr:P-loop containing nucleoside triphosphate hydrolase protein [Crassisporium funariophilum]